MPASNHVVPTEIFTVLAELLFQLHGCVLADGPAKVPPRKVQLIASLLARLESEEALPTELRQLCECLCRDWRDCGKPVVHEYSLASGLCAA